MKRTLTALTATVALLGVTVAHDTAPAQALATTTVSISSNVQVQQWVAPGQWRPVCVTSYRTNTGTPNPVQGGESHCAPFPPSVGGYPAFTVTVSTHWGAPVNLDTVHSAWCVTTDPVLFPGCLIWGTYIPFGVHDEIRPFGWFQRWCGWTGGWVTLGFLSLQYNGTSQSTLDVGDSCNA